MLMTLIVIAATAVVEMMSTSILNLLSMLHLQNQLLPKKMLKQPQVKRLDQKRKRVLLLTLALRLPLPPPQLRLLKKHQQKKHQQKKHQQKKKKQNQNSSQILLTKSQRKLSLGIMLSAL